MTDVSFQLSLVEAGPNWVVTANCPNGEANATIAAPFDGEELSHRLAEIERSMIRSTSPVVTRRAASPERVTREFGQELSKAILDGNVRLLFDRARTAARQQNGEVQILLKPVGPALARIPWEFLTDPDTPDDYLALRVPFVRSAYLMAAVPPLTVEPPLRVLGLVSRPNDLPKLEADEERRQITKTLETVSSDLIRIDWLESNRWRDLQSRLRSGTYHVFHFIGHGGFDEEQGSGYVELTDDDGNARKVCATDLGRLAYNNPMLRLVMLNACESAASGDTGVFSSTAATLLQEGVPAVVAMQYEVTDPAALAFAACFYEGIARGKPVAQAVTFAREEVKVTFGSLEWATPVLFLASDDSEIFRMVPRRPNETVGLREPAPPSPLPGPTRPPDSGPGGPGTPTGATTRAEGSEWLPQLRHRLADLVAGNGSGATPATAATGSDRGPTSATFAGTGAAVGPTAAPPFVAPTVRLTRSLPASTLPEPALLRLGQPCDRLAAGPGPLVATVGADAAIHVLSTSTGRTVASCLLPQQHRPRRICWSPWPRHLASLHDGGLAVVWDLETEVPVRVITTPAERSGDIAVSANGRWLAVAADDLTVRVFDADGSQVKKFSVTSEPTPDQGWRPPIGSITSVAFGPGDKHLVVATDDGLLRMFDVHGSFVLSWPHPRPITGAALCTSALATGSSDGRLRVWGWDGRLLRRIEVGAVVLFVAVSRDGQLLAVVTEDSACQVWDRDGAIVGSDAFPGRPIGLAFSSEQQRLVSGTDSGEIRVWSLESAGAAMERER